MHFFQHFLHFIMKKKKKKYSQTVYRSIFISGDLIYHISDISYIKYDLSVVCKFTVLNINMH